MLQRVQSLHMCDTVFSVLSTSRYCFNTTLCLLETYVTVFLFLNLDEKRADALQKFI